MIRPRPPLLHRLLAAMLTASCVCGADDELALGVRTTGPLAPAEQRTKFVLPPGFEIQLVAAEPDIHKPMNLAFDAEGRLWVTTSIEYPWAAPTNRPGRDRLMIFDDFGPDGRARKVTEFAGGLNIPIGVYPFRTDTRGWKAIVWSIPHIWLLEDTDGDGRADRRTPLIGPFDHTRDTHGNQASFRRGFDGWLYATHGFNNDSHVAGRDGGRVDLNSGNTYRFRTDGTRIEHHTHGQVNPFGLAWDARGNLYSSDCHSAPIYQLLAGGWYPSFGKPHDGLGFAPVMLEHAHGSTAIDGAMYYEDDLWPYEYRDTFLIGNVMTSRLNRDRITFAGSTPRASEQPDFLTSTDPWFRPVDNLLGPDGALYVADFYNRIIGHYEVPLTHPGRDRERGRIWRVVYLGTDGAPKLRPAALPAGLDALVAELASPSLNRRLLAMSEIEDRFGADAVPALRRAALGDGPSSSAAAKARRKIHSLWLLQRLGALTATQLAPSAADADSLVRVHAQRIAADVLQRATRALAVPEDLVQAAQALATGALSDPDALVRRCAAEALGHLPHENSVRPLIAALLAADPADTHLAYVLRKSLRDHLAHQGTFDGVRMRTDWTDAELAAMTDVAVAVKSSAAAGFLIGRMPALGEKGSPSLAQALRHAARYATEADLPGLAAVARERFAGLPSEQLALFRSVDQGLRERGTALPEAVRAWGTAIAGAVLSGPADSGWANAPLDAAPTANPWDFQERRRGDGPAMRVLSSFPQGEALTGALRSPEFAAGPEFAFWLCGHDGPPDKPAQGRNGVSLRDAVTGEVLFKAPPPRDDAARRVVWNTAALAGRRVYFEATDADTGGAYAWLAFGGVEGGPALPEAPPATIVAERLAAVDIASRLGSTPQLSSLLRALALTPGDPGLRAAAARADIAATPDEEAVVAYGAMLADAREPWSVREAAGTALARKSSEAARGAVLLALQAAPGRVQAAWTRAIAETPRGPALLLDAAADGSLPPARLLDPAVRDRIRAAAPPDWERRMESATRGLPSEDAAREKLVAARRVGFAAGAGRAEEGRRVFDTHCAACHQIDGRGGLVGPQLAGIGNRGVERLCEDILDPNRNVDHAFRQSLLTLKDGETLPGLFRREEGDLLVLADATGREFTVPKSDVAKREESPLSPMPDNFGEAIPTADFDHLLAFLLSRR